MHAGQTKILKTVEEFRMTIKGNWTKSHSLVFCDDSFSLSVGDFSSLFLKTKLTAKDCKN